MRRRPLLVPGIAAALVLTGWWIQHLLAQRLPRDVATERVPDHYVRNFRAVEFSSQGIPEHMLRASGVRHFADEDLSELDNPVFVVEKPGQDLWRIQARRGRVQEHGNLVWLDGEVRVNRAPSASGEAVAIQTRDLRLLRDKAYAETSAPASIETDHHRIEGKGLQAWLEQPTRVKLLSNVRARHEWF
ncbi:MAG: LPS export ABC transporter periplasmic protein LptC [Pseudomonadota bacterium]